MKTLLIFIATFSTALFAHASGPLSCFDQDGNVASLQINGARNSVVWNEPWHSAGSAGVAAGKESAPFSELKGFDLFKLVDFYRTNESGYVLALGPVNAAGEIKAVVYFDNDDHMEEETIFTCK